MHVAAELGRLLGPLRRALLRRTREAADLPDLPEAQIQLLRVLEAEQPLGTREVADRLRLAPSTVSNLVRTMSGNGLVQRRVSERDLRSTELAATDHALQLLRRYDAASDATMREALDDLGPQDRRAVVDALPALRKLVESLEKR